MAVVQLVRNSLISVYFGGRIRKTFCYIECEVSGGGREVKADIKFLTLDSGVSKSKTD